jgi:hypothetical protein
MNIAPDEGTARAIVDRVDVVRDLGRVWTCCMIYAWALCVCCVWSRQVGICGRVDDGKGREHSRRLEAFIAAQQVGVSRSLNPQLTWPHAGADRVSWCFEGEAGL